MNHPTSLAKPSTGYFGNQSTLGVKNFKLPVTGRRTGGLPPTMLPASPIKREKYVNKVDKAKEEQLNPISLRGFFNV